MIGALNKIDRLFGSTFGAKYSHFKSGFHRPVPRSRRNSNIFIHIPRTGGTSINSFQKKLIQKNILSEEIIKYVDEHYIPDFSLPLDYYNYITIIRNPIDRAISYFKLQLRDQHEPYSHLAKKSERVFISKCWEVNNLYVRYFSNSVNKKYLGREELDLSFKTLKSFHKLIRFEDFPNEVQKLFPYQNIGIPHLNKTIEEITKNNFTKLLKEVNYLDIELYDRLQKELL